MLLSSNLDLISDEGEIRENKPPQSLSESVLRKSSGLSRAIASGYSESNVCDCMIGGEASPGAAHSRHFQCRAPSPGTPPPAPLKPRESHPEPNPGALLYCLLGGQGSAVLHRSVPLKRAVVMYCAIAAPLCSVRASGKLREQGLKVYLWGNPQTPSRKP
jgi:hypothetical protein